MDLQVKYKQSPAKATSVGVTPEVERVKQNQENISSARRTQVSVSSCRALLRPPAHGCTRLHTSDPATASAQEDKNVSVCLQVKYQRGLQELRGRSCSELDTPEYRRVRRTQDSVSMVASWLSWLPLWEELT